MSTAIEWTDATWNPVTGCTKVSAGCDHCYIDRTPPFRMEHRRFDLPTVGGTTGLRLHPDRLSKPYHWAKPRRVFVNSLSDLFHDDVPDGFIAQVWNVMARTPQHTYQILTKRPGRMRSWVKRWADTAADRAVQPGEGGFLPPMPRGPEAVRAVYKSGRGQLFADMLESMGDPPPGAAYPLYDWQEGQRWWPRVLPNVWLGVSVEDAAALFRVDVLREVPAAVRFLSCEPLLGPIDGVDLAEVEWVIVGGESGPGARPMHPGWARSLRDQCTAAEVPFFFKQWGEWASVDQLPDDTAREVDAAMNLGQPHPDPMRVGKKRAGRELDGRTWDEYPVVTSRPSRPPPSSPAQPSPLSPLG